MKAGRGRAVEEERVTGVPSRSRPLGDPPGTARGLAHSTPSRGRGGQSPPDRQIDRITASQSASSNSYELNTRVWRRMARGQKSLPLCLLLCGSAGFLLLWSPTRPGPVQLWRQRRDEQEHTAGLRSEELQRPTEEQESSEFPGEHFDPAAIDLTSLVNTLINSSQSGSPQLFSLLSVTSYSSMALHKLTLLVYNISSVKNIESSMFRRRFCYCITNQTNDLTDFTAILLDVMGNSSSYLHELFKSASILSVSQQNNSDCIYICVMAGQLGRERPELWAVDSITPLFNQTIVEGPHTGKNTSAGRAPVAVEWTSGSVNRSLIMSPPVSRVHSTAHASPSSLAELSSEGGAVIPPVTSHPRTPIPATPPNTADHFHLPISATAPASRPAPSLAPRVSAMSPTVPPTHVLMVLTTRTPPAEGSTQRQPSTAAADTPSEHPQRTTTAPRRTTTPIEAVSAEPPGCPWRRAELEVSAVKISSHKLQPCVFELCKFYSQCLCRSFKARRPTKRYCSDSHLWYQKHTLEVCRRVRRLSFSRNLKQRCLSKMCDKL